MKKLNNDRGFTLIEGDCPGFTDEAKRSRRIGTVPGSSMNNKGFTLIELMIVMSIIGILLTIAQPMYRESTIKAKEAVLMENLFTLRDVIDQFYIDKGRYPDSVEELVDNFYIRSVPKDPFTGSTDTWQLIPPPEGYEGGVYDVHSGSDLIALNDIPYNEW